ncbi:zincin [Lentithecium fluviatile CBS 122367]|uniref:Zincin n=1 Tax=Lentithecium fluviatile CBS 122367 TaxID=1168545 RepID=A0A6G1IE83_9PLEO|nr:zincin [Lentithecium fluviatile CBS 122367]
MHTTHLSTLIPLLLPYLCRAEPIPQETPNTIDKDLTTLEIHVAPNPLLTNDTTCLLGIECPEGTTQTVSYFTSVNDKAIIHGDVIFGSEADILAAAVNNTDENVTKRAYSIWPWEFSRKWPLGMILYQYEDATTAAGRGPKFEAAIKRWTNMLPFLSFVKYPDGDVNQPGVLMVRAIEDSTTYSYIGYVPYPEVQLGRPDLPETDYWYTHSIGHTLGLMHEHQRPDRDAYLTLDCSKVARNANGDTPVCGDSCVGTGCYFNILNFGEDWSGTYDIESIMHFNPGDFAKDLNDPPLKPIDPIVFGDRVFPTVTDANRVCDIYYEVCRGVCGDGILALANGEACDDGNNIDGDGCSADCRVEIIPTEWCGDTIVQTNLGEECEPPNTDTCDAFCHLKDPQPHCGNNNIEFSLGEECEPPNTPTCDADCHIIPDTNPGTCPNHCNPNVPDNLCHETTSCIALFGASGDPGLPFGLSYGCACRAGFRADGVDPADSSKQVRFSATEYTSWVFVEPGLSCDTLCSPDTNPYPCSEVPRHDECW